MRKKKQSKFPAKYVLLIMTILCAVIIGCSLKTSGSGTVSAAAGAVLAPMQKGVYQLGSGLTVQPAGASADKEKSGKRK